MSRSCCLAEVQSDAQMAEPKAEESLKVVESVKNRTGGSKTLLQISKFWIAVGILEKLP